LKRDQAENTLLWRTSQSELQEYLSINRALGEDFSLQIEVVLINSCVSLFKKTNDLVYRLSKVINSKLSDKPISEESLGESDYDSENMSSELEEENE